MHDHDLYDFYVLVYLFFLRARSLSLIPTKRRPQEISGTCAHPGSLSTPMSAYEASTAPSMHLHQLWPALPMSQIYEPPTRRRRTRLRCTEAVVCCLSIAFKKVLSSINVQGHGVGRQIIICLYYREFRGWADETRNS